MNYYEEYEMLSTKAARKRRIVNWILRRIFNIDSGRACLPWNYKGNSFDIKEGEEYNKDGTLMTEISDSYSSQQ